MVLLNELPKVMPNPLSNGSHTNFPYASVLLTRTLSHLIISRQFMYISSFLDITYSPKGMINQDRIAVSTGPCSVDDGRSYLE
jgi:hypothetical protein